MCESAAGVRVSSGCMRRRRVCEAAQRGSEVGGEGRCAPTCEDNGARSCGNALSDARGELRADAKPTVLVASCRNRRPCAGTSLSRPSLRNDSAKSSGDALHDARRKLSADANPTILVGSCRNHRRCAGTSPRRPPAGEGHVRSPRFPVTRICPYPMGASVVYHRRSIAYLLGRAL